MKSYKITLGRTGGSITPLTEPCRNEILKWHKRTLQFFNYSRKDRNGRPILVKSFGIVIESGYELLLIRTHLVELDMYLKDNGFEGEIVEVTNDVSIDPESKYSMDTDKEPYDYQETIIEQMMEYDALPQSSRIQLLSLQTGKGKSFTSLVLGSRLAEGRLVLITKSNHIQQWVGDIVNETDIDKSEIKVVNGVANLIKLQKDPSKYRAIIISTSTLASFYNKYDTDIPYLENPKEEATYNPYKLFKKLAAGIVLIDEVDELVHVHYRTLAYDLPISRIIGMSASFFDTIDAKKNAIYSRMFPERERRFIKLDKYIDYTTLAFRFKSIGSSNIVYTNRGSDDYNHIAYEKWIIRNPLVLAQYINIVKYMILEDFIRHREVANPEQGLFLFTAGLDMLEVINDRIFKTAPYNKLSSCIYTGEQGTLDEVRSSVLTLTTTGKAASAVDRPGLITCISTVSTNSTRVNIQIAGRLRKDKNGAQTRFVNIINKSIPQQTNYSKNNAANIRDRVRNLLGFDIDIPDNSFIESLEKELAHKFEL